MRARGRKPFGAVVIAGQFGKRAPPPPDDLTLRQAAIWRDVVATEDPDFFATAALLGLLADYCRRRDASEGVSAVIDTFQPAWLKSNEGVKRYGALLALRDLECRGAAALAVKLRLTNQSRYTPMASATAARNAPKGPKPWEV